MPSIGWLEILIIVSIAIIVVGPKDFPFMLKKIGSWIGSAKRYVRDVQGQVSDLTNETLSTDIEEKPKSENQKKNYNFLIKNNLAFQKLPIDLPKVEQHLIWHSSDDNEGPHLWMKDLLIEAFAEAQKV